MLLFVSCILFVLSLALVIFALWQKLPAIQLSALTLPDISNLLTVFLTMVGLAVALVSLYVAIVTYQQSVKDSHEQQKNLDASRAQLQAVVDAAAKQQDILNQNLETSRVQQVLLSKSLDTSKQQHDIQQKHLETSKAQLGVLEQQQRQEAERLSRKPIAEVSILTTTGPKPVDDPSNFPQVNFPLENNKKWSRVVFLILNKGTAEISKPIIRIVASPETVFVDSADMRVTERTEHNVIQFSGAHVIDIDPEAVAGGPLTYSVDITVPDSIDAFDLRFSVSGKNLPKQAHILHFKVTRPSS